MYANSLNMGMELMCSNVWQQPQHGDGINVQ